MSGMRYKYFAGLFTTAALAGALSLSAAPQAETPNYQDPEADNANQQTTVTTVTETQPALSDHRIRREMHKLIFSDATMSQRARNVRVISRDGHVTLKGSVPTTMEKEKRSEERRVGKEWRSRW